MKIGILTVGKTKDKEIGPLIERYLGKLRHYLKIEYVELPDVKECRAGDPEAQKAAEGKLILGKTTPGDCVVLLDEKGKELTSRELSEFLTESFNRLQNTLWFVIGGPYGFSAEVYGRADRKLSLSRLTFTHEMARAILAEQIYRAMTIIRGEPYHHD